MPFDPLLSAPSPSEADRVDAEERRDRWASTMKGFVPQQHLRAAHEDSHATFGPVVMLTREERESIEQTVLAPGATRSNGAGSRQRAEDPDPFRTCFERDRDRILHASAFRRLAGKTQVFVFPRDHQRTRLTHCLEVAQVARSIASALRLNVALAEAIALGHDCGHGPGGHASEDAFSTYLPDGFDHAVFGSDVVLAPLNLTAEVSDGIRNHSWSRPAPSTPEGEAVSWADRIAYVCHDFEDALHAGIIGEDELPEVVRRRCGVGRGEQLGTFIDGLVIASATAGQIVMPDDLADALATFRAFNYERVYLRPDSLAQARSVVEVLRALVDHLIAHPGRLPGALDSDPVGAAVAYVAQMTDRYAFDLAVSSASWPPDDLPRGVDVG